MALKLSNSNILGMTNIDSTRWNTDLNQAEIWKTPDSEYVPLTVGGAAASFANYYCPTAMLLNASGIDIEFQLNTSSNNLTDISYDAGQKMFTLQPGDYALDLLAVTDGAGASRFIEFLFVDGGTNV